MSLNQEYFKGVRSRMTVNSTVRFGVNIKRTSPYYEVFHSAVGRRFQYNGKTNENFGLAKSEFEDKNLSRPYTYPEIARFMKLGHSLQFTSSE